MGRLADLIGKHGGIVVLDDASPAGSLRHQLEDRLPDVRVVSAREYGQACGVLFDAVTQGEVRHPPNVDLEAAARGATKRALGDAWAWSRRNSAVDISPLVAVTLALHGAMSTIVDDGPLIEVW